MAQKLGPGMFHGTRRSVRAFAGLTLSEYEFAPNSTIPRHCHEQTYLSLVLDGHWREAYDRKVRERKPLTLTIHPAGELHSEQLGQGGARAFHVEFSADWLRRMNGYASSLQQPTQVEGGPLTWHALRLYAEFRQLDPHSGLIVEGILLESLGVLARHKNQEARAGAPAWLLQARAMVHARFAESLSLPEVAGAVGVHPVHLARTFRRHYRSSIGAYIRQLRLEYACRELTTSDRPLADIALAAGFVDQSHLSRSLRRFVGMSPASFRRNSR